MLLGEMGWDYQSLRDAWFQRSANWNALFDPSTGQFDESFAVSGDDEVHLSGYEYHPTNTNLWKTPLEEALEELFPLDYLDTTGDPPSSTDPSASDHSGDSSDGGDLDDYAGDYQGDVFGEEEGGSSGGVYYTAYSGSGQSQTVSGPMVWLYTGSWRVDRSVWDAALGAAAESVTQNYMRDLLEKGAYVDPTPIFPTVNEIINGGIEGKSVGEIGEGIVVGMVPIPGIPAGKLARNAAKYGDEAAEAGKRLVDNAPKGAAAPVRRLGRAPEFPAGRLHEDVVLDRAIDYLGPGYRELSPGRYVSADGLRQFRYGAHEIRNPANHHAHFEALDEFGRVIENSVVEIFR
ncbi:MAG: hypothetical protein KatS3mg111_3982 [Pirellulaceae bacterium]|nr:MAG: hypothetical protein KatS3mg111_3982 [Pirellulaceae bacterium]